ncbi:acyltransferase family protein [Mesorhizobium escarrei]|nr:acyltransferase [Mesorhizobium escarrei]
MKYRADISGLRAVAVVPVVLYHAGFSAVSGGFVGVDVFFVISGFLITSDIIERTDRGEFSLLDFYHRRVRRILPALFAMLAACFCDGVVCAAAGRVHWVRQQRHRRRGFRQQLLFLPQHQLFH